MQDEVPHSFFMKAPTPLCFFICTVLKELVDSESWLYWGFSALFPFTPVRNYHLNVLYNINNAFSMCTAEDKKKEFYEIIQENDLI